MVMGNLWRVGIFTFLLWAVSPTSLIAAPFESGYKALEIWDDKAMQTAPLALKIWLYFMTAVLAAGLLFIWRHPIARWIVGGTIGIILAVGFLAPALGLVTYAGLASLSHLIFWSPGLYLLLKEKPFLKGRSPFAIWSGVVCAMILISFVFDVRDAAIYLYYMAGFGILS